MDRARVPTDPTANSAEWILVVEDDLQVRQTIAWTLESEGWQIGAAPNGRNALELAKRQKPGVVVLDMGLSDIDGFAVAEGVRAVHGQSVPIVLVTADGRAAEKAARVGAYAYLNKPVDLDELIDTVRDALHAV
jgi:two-component system KDP operon response regulator KdpE